MGTHKIFLISLNYQNGDSTVWTMHSASKLLHFIDFINLFHCLKSIKSLNRWYSVWLSAILDDLFFYSWLLLQDTFSYSEVCIWFMSILTRTLTSVSLRICMISPFSSIRLIVDAIYAERIVLDSSFITKRKDGVYIIAI